MKTHGLSHEVPKDGQFGRLEVGHREARALSLELRHLVTGRKLHRGLTLNCEFGKSGKCERRSLGAPLDRLCPEQL